MSSSRKRNVVLIALALLFVGSIGLSAQDSPRRGRKYKSPPPTSRIEVTVVRDTDSKPIENASVIFQLIGDDKGNMELKTNEDGKSVIDVLPIGSKMRLQILAKGYQTYGQDFDIDKPALTYDVRLKRPGRQYSIYEHHDQAGSNQKDDQKNDQKDEKNPDAATQKDKPKDKPDSSPDQPSKPQSR
jgi:hypothetical protein